MEDFSGAQASTEIGTSSWGLFCRTFVMKHQTWHPNLGTTLGKEGGAAVPQDDPQEDVPIAVVPWASEKPSISVLLFDLRV